MRNTHPGLDDAVHARVPRPVASRSGRYSVPIARPPRGGTPRWPSLRSTTRLLWAPPHPSPAAETLEVFGWLLIAESLAIVFLPGSVLALLGGLSLGGGGVTVFRISGVLFGGLGLLYVIGARLGASGLVFASLVSRPLVAAMLTGFWWLGLASPGIALALALQEVAGSTWTLAAWRDQDGVPG